MADLNNNSEQTIIEDKGAKASFPFGLIIFYASIWIFSVIFFWVFTDGSDALGYSLLFTWMLLPASAFITALIAAAKRYFRKYRWLLIPAFGTAHMLAEYFTFSLAYMASFEKFRIIAPDWTLFLVGAAVSAVGLGTGALISRMRKSSDISKQTTR